MVSVKELRVRITSVGNIKQITRAMEMVASTKLRRFQERATASRPYTLEIAGLVEHLAAVLGDEALEMPLFRAGAGSRVCMLLVTSDRGLCGAYNSNVFHALEAWIREQRRAGLEEADLDFFVYGRKGYRYLEKRGLNVTRFLVDPPLEEVDFVQAAHTSRQLVAAFLSGEYSRVDLLSTAFESMARFKPRVMAFLPVAPPAGGSGEAADVTSMILEPGPEEIFESLVPRYLETRIFGALVEALTSEYASRRVSMKAATDAATDMQKLLKGKYNRLRQEGITMELLDLVGGTEAQK
ncbi:MAG TPA: ATP synthase F1 subunit gamma [Planctomycetes bacterium]|nr:ATP synthase F1 subunit gamma [Planctomycetota bacterium]HIL53138.1 ATP synthase F1 subunit gamma [Planctomycetota bacterium]